MPFLTHACWFQRALRDTLLRLAEEPSLYIPRWSDEIIAEMVRTLERDIGVAPDKTAHLVTELKKHFADSWAPSHERWLEQVTNDPKDKHVLAAAIAGGAPIIVTYNKRHFPQVALEPWGIDVQGPSTFLKDLYEMDSDVVIQKLNEQASNIGRSLSELLHVLKRSAPRFVALIANDLKINL